MANTPFPHVSAISRTRSAEKPSDLCRCAVPRSRRAKFAADGVPQLRNLARDLICEARLMFSRNEDTRNCRQILFVMEELCQIFLVTKRRCHILLVTKQWCQIFLVTKRLYRSGSDTQLCQWIEFCAF